MRNALAAAVLILVAACIPAPVVRIASHYQAATPAPWMSLSLSVDGPVEDAGALLTQHAAAVALSYKCAVPGPGDVQLLSKEVKTEGKGQGLVPIDPVTEGLNARRCQFCIHRATPDRLDGTALGVFLHVRKLRRREGFLLWEKISTATVNGFSLMGENLTASCSCR